MHHKADNKRELILFSFWVKPFMAPAEVALGSWTQEPGLPIAEKLQIFLNSKNTENLLEIIVISLKIAPPIGSTALVRLPDV